MKDRARLMKLLKRYRFALAMAAVTAAVLIFRRETGLNALRHTGDNLLDILSVIPPIFILLGLLDVWVPRETIIRLMGERSGWLGAFLAFFMGSAAAGPLYAAFPVAGVLLKKGSKLSNVWIFVGAWSTTKLPLLLFEASAMGLSYMALRLAIDIAGIILIALLLERLLGPGEKRAIYERARSYQ